MRGKSLISLVGALCSTVIAVHAQHPYEMHPLPGDDGVKTQVIGGTPATEREWPVTLQFVGEGGFCTSTVVGDRAILTAGHCVLNNSQGRVLLNNTWTDILCSRNTDFPGKRCIAPSTFEDFLGCTADIALCVADKPFKFMRPSGALVKAESINRDPGSVRANMIVTMLGYGCTVPGGPFSETLNVGSATIKSVSIPGISKIDPKRALEEYVIAEALGGATLCIGDSGGSAYDTKAVTERRIVGINSRGNLSTLSYFTNTSDNHILTFIGRWSSDNRAPICGIDPNAHPC